MRFVSWNVNGLRACLTKGFAESFDKLNADVFCLQETKMQPGQADFHPEGYEEYVFSAEKKGYSGTACYTRIHPLSVRQGLGIPEFDCEGRTLTLEFEQCWLVNVYVPNSQDKLARIDYRVRWEDALRTYLKELDAQKPVVLCGDLNIARTPIDLKNPKANDGAAGYSQPERDKLEELLAAGFTDSFRHLYPDLEGAYSWWSYRFKARERNAGWRIDYFLVSDRVKQNIKAAAIHSDVFGSDHCPISLDLEL